MTACPACGGKLYGERDPFTTLWESVECLCGWHAPADVLAEINLDYAAKQQQWIERERQAWAAALGLDGAALEALRVRCLATEGLDPDAPAATLDPTFRIPAED